MSKKKNKMVTIDGNEAAAYSAYHVNEIIAIYPITPSSPMGEHSDEWSAKGEPNIWGTVPRVTEMQSEGGASGAVHGSLQRGALTTTFTASQGLLLMIPNMFKIAGELTSTVFNVAARSIATHALSIFGEHSDVMATRTTGFALMPSNSVQEAMDFALIAQEATLETRVPFVHFFDGFRTSHEVSKVELIDSDDMRAFINDDMVRAHRERRLNPDKPFIRGTAQNPDVFFQASEAVNPYYIAAPDIVQKVMDRFAEVVGRKYELFQYVGAKDADRIIIIMGSGAETAQETVEYLSNKGEKVGLIKVRLYRPFSIKHLIDALPKTVRKIAVLDRTKEPGATGEPLYVDVVSALNEACSELETMPIVVGGRYGLSSKEFTPAMVKGIFDELTKKSPKNHFSIGINDDVTHLSVSYDDSFRIEPASRTKAVFFGLGSDGTVGANKNSIKIIGLETDNHAQGYFVYDSRKAGSLTVSHLRFGPDPIHSPYLITEADFVACHQFPFLERFDVLKIAAQGAIFLLNSPYTREKLWAHLPKTVQRHIIEKKLKFYVIDAYEVAQSVGLGVRINTIMQTCFFSLSKIISKEQSIKSIKEFIKKTYSRRGEKVVEMNYAAVDNAIDNLYEVDVPSKVSGNFDIRKPVPDIAPKFVREVTAKMIAYDGDSLPVSAFAPDGTFPVATTKWEKRNISLEIPVWESDICIQCGKCILVCPHAVIRSKLYDAEVLAAAPKSFKSAPARLPKFKGRLYTLQVAPEDCTGCTLCVAVCPVKDKTNPERRAINMAEQLPIRELETENWDFFLDIKEVDRDIVNKNLVAEVQYLQPLFEFSGACAGCGETPYLKLLTQLFGERAVIANATGCSSIYGANLPTTPWACNKEGRGPVWSNSLFEDNAEFGLGMRLAIDKEEEYANELLDKLKNALGIALVSRIKEAKQTTEQEIYEQRSRIYELKKKLETMSDREAKELLSVAEVLVKRSIWIVGGDGWAYDIGYGGLDHVLALGRNVNVLVLDTEVYSNTGGQMSKATPLGAVAKFAFAGKNKPKKDLALMATNYGYVYVARIAMGANDRQTVKAFLEAEAYDGPSIIIAYSHCIAHGYNLGIGMDQQKKAVLTGYWPLMRYNPTLYDLGKNPLQLDSHAPSLPLKDYIYNESRYKTLLDSNPTEAKRLYALAQKDILKKWRFLEYMSKMPVTELQTPPEK